MAKRRIRSGFAPFYQARDTDLGSHAFYTLHRVPRLFSDHERLTGKYRSIMRGPILISPLWMETWLRFQPICASWAFGPCAPIAICPFKWPKGLAARISKLESQCAGGGHPYSRRSDQAASQPGVCRGRYPDHRSSFRAVCLAAYQPPLAELSFAARLRTRTPGPRAAGYPQALHRSQ